MALQDRRSGPPIAEQGFLPGPIALVAISQRLLVTRLLSIVRQYLGRAPGFEVGGGVMAGDRGRFGQPRPSSPLIAPEAPAYRASWKWRLPHLTLGRDRQAAAIPSLTLERGGRHACRPVEKTQAELRPEPLDLVGHRRARQSWALSGAAETPRLAHAGEGPNLVEPVYRSSPPNSDAGVTATILALQGPISRPVRPPEK